MKPPRIFKVNGYYCLHSDEEIEQWKKSAKTEEDKKCIETYLSCEVKECPNTL